MSNITNNDGMDKYYVECGTYMDIVEETDFQRYKLIEQKGKLINLTKMLGAKQADYMYEIERNHTGDGVAAFNHLFPSPSYFYEEFNRERKITP